MKDRGAIDISAARQRQEKCQEQNVDLYMIFVDLLNVFTALKGTHFYFFYMSTLPKHSTQSVVMGFGK